ncbi:hypothetical protein LshimejAT787_0902550 [Lyophyllum shimeji]|uniref:Uncharacterized protein n=1 Tax=Lyophyllum shimeji TaxID=47721 RepID=A0A9P3PQW8_LYOSH|nr:hypothetical protein LshimejAT787_0902550 [Lyophyllum shimeji]
MEKQKAGRTVGEPLPRSSSVAGQSDSMAPAANDVHAVIPTIALLTAEAPAPTGGPGGRNYFELAKGICERMTLRTCAQPGWTVVPSAGLGRRVGEAFGEAFNIQAQCVASRAFVCTSRLLSFRAGSPLVFHSRSFPSDLRFGHDYFDCPKHFVDRSSQFSKYRVPPSTDVNRSSTLTRDRVKEEYATLTAPRRGCRIHANGYRHSVSLPQRGHQDVRTSTSFMTKEILNGRSRSRGGFHSRTIARQYLLFTKSLPPRIVDITGE